MSKVNVYIDGFNFYHGLEKEINDKNSKWTEKYKWCDLKKLSQRFLDNGDELNNVYYFTAYSWDVNKKKRHKLFVRALHHFGTNIILGNFSNVTRTYYKKMPILKLILNKICDTLDLTIKTQIKPELLKYKTYEEKQTDVNIAIKIVEDGYKNDFDKAIILSGDSDIIPAIKSVKKSFIEKQFININLPNSKGKNIKKVCDDFKLIKSDDIINSLFPDKIQINENEFIEIPTEWNINS